MPEILDHPTHIVTISGNATVKEAAVEMSTYKVGCLIVNDTHGKLAGILTERDIVSGALAVSKCLDEIAVSEIMTRQVVACPVGTSTSEAIRIMTTNKIRHLPMVDDGIVVAMLSSRDVMEQQLLEDRAAAQEVATLLHFLKSMDLDEVAKIVVSEVPKLFQANNYVFYLRKNAFATRDCRLVSSEQCLCPQEHLRHLEDFGESHEQHTFWQDTMPPACETLGAQRPRLVIPLGVAGPKESSSDKSTQLSGYLCMCGLSASITANKELTSYKAKLAREILNSHLTNATLYQEAKQTSLTDALTGIGSRILLEDRLEAECVRAKRYKRPFSVAIIDLDNFKMINDSLGHASGDDTLKKLAACMRSQKRATDTLARYGGDEFVILMPETKADNASILLERLRTKVQGIELAKDLPITISCGIAEGLPDHPNPSSEVMRRADMALYEAKSAGRDCVKIWDKTMSELLDADVIEAEEIKKLQRRVVGLSEQAENMFIQSIWGLVQALEAKDTYAKKHSENVMRYCLGIARAMEIAPKQIEIIRHAAMIHDIGKIGIPDAILCKPGKLTRRERTVIEQHPLIAVHILEKMTFLQREIAIIRHHHEKWNGQGYPDGLRKTSIPFEARIIAVADTFDALTSSRSYHDSRSLPEAMEILVDSSGYEFDPKVVKGMVCWVEKVRGLLGKARQLTPADLLDSQKHLDCNSMAPLVYEGSASDCKV
jgi:diguanylate cyclase (GGDEF)-like protein